MTIRVAPFTLIALLGLTLPAVAAVPFEVIAKPSKAYNHRAGSIEVARTPEELAVLWPSISLRDPLPVVDFQNRMVVVYFMGPMPDLGSGVQIDEIQIRGGTMILQVSEWDCGGGQMTHAPALVLTTVRWPRSIVSDRRPRGCDF